LDAGFRGNVSHAPEGQRIPDAHRSEVVFHFFLAEHVWVCRRGRGEKDRLAVGLGILLEPVRTENRAATRTVHDFDVRIPVEVPLKVLLEEARGYVGRTAWCEWHD